jgi:hypothetical protein
VVLFEIQIPAKDGSSMRVCVAVALAVAMGLGYTACRKTQEPVMATSKTTGDSSDLSARALIAISQERELDLDEATALQDELDDAMIATMLRYVDDCELMADRLEGFLTARRREYEAVAATLSKTPWSARELPPDRLRWRLERADETVRKMSPASNACRVNVKVAAVMGAHFYTP